MTLKLIVCAGESECLAACQQQFEERPWAEVRQQDVLETDCDAIIVPGNSFGFLDSGIELRVTELFGFELQDRLREAIVHDHDQELLVGHAVPISVESPPRVLLYAPIWRVPQSIPQTVNAYLAVRGALQALQTTWPDVLSEDGPVRTVATSLLGVEGGAMAPGTSARQIRYATEVFLGLRGAKGKNLTQLLRRDRKLKAVPKPPPPA